MLCRVVGVGTGNSAWEQGAAPWSCWMGRKGGPSPLSAQPLAQGCDLLHPSRHALVAVCLPICLCLSICLFIHLSTIHPPTIHPSTIHHSSFIHSFIHHPFVYQSAHHPSIHPPTHLSSHLSVCTFIYLSACLSPVCLFFSSW